MRKSWKKKISLFWRGWGLSIVIAVLIATSFKSAIADWNDIPTGSMRPTILIGDRVFVNKLAYDLKVPYTTWHLATWSAPQRGDIVVFYSPENGKRLIKRVIGLPGDTISMANNRLSINGVEIQYETPNRAVLDELLEGHRPAGHLYIENLLGRKHPVMLTRSGHSRPSFRPIDIPKDKYWMLGDNRDDSADSRFFGLVDRSLIVGRATTVVLSRDESLLNPRFERFLKGLS